MKTAWATSPPATRQLAAMVKNRLKKIQYRPVLFDGFLARTGLTVVPQPP